MAAQLDQLVLLMSEAVVAFAEPPVDAVDVIHELILSAVAAFEADGVGVLLRGEDGRAQTLLATDADASAAEQHQLHWGEGPCLEAFVHRAPVLVTTRAEGCHRWPSWRDVPAAYGSVLAVPFTLRGELLGTLNLLARREHAFSTADIGRAARVADLVTAALTLHRRAIHSDDVASQLQDALHARAVVEQATGMLAALERITPDEALVLLRREAHIGNLLLSDLCQDLIADVQLRGSPGQRGFDR